MGTGEDSSSPARVGTPLRRVQTGDEASTFRHRTSTTTSRRLSTQDSSTLSPNPGLRRRSSTFSDYSLREARRSLQDDLLVPGVKGERDGKEESSPWHSAPLAFALLPAVGGMLFTNGSSVVTDVMLLGLAGIFLNWSVRVPWDWYHSAQSHRKLEEYNGESMFGDESEEENALSFSKETLEEVPEDEEAEDQPTSSTPSLPPKHISSLPRRRSTLHEHATNELYTHEILALLSCFIFPACGAYLLHTIRSQLTRPSEGLVSNYNLTIFLLAAEIRPMAHMVKLIQARTLHLQRVVSEEHFESVRGVGGGEGGGDMKALMQRIDELESRNSSPTSPTQTTEIAHLTPKQTTLITTEVRRTIQPDFDALNRAVRRYEKRATLQAFQTDSRIHELEARLNDAISLAAAAARGKESQRGVLGWIGEWIGRGVMAQVGIVAWIISLPWKATSWGLGIAGLGKTGKGERLGERERGRKAVNGAGSGVGSGKSSGEGRYYTNGNGKSLRVSKK